MIIEYELQGDQLLHKGIFETTGFWVKYGEDRDDATNEIMTYKLWSNLHFSFETSDVRKFNAVYEGLLLVLSKQNDKTQAYTIEDIGFFLRLL
jgi:hypothetical protein